MEHSVNTVAVPQVTVHDVESRVESAEQSNISSDCYNRALVSASLETHFCKKASGKKGSGKATSTNQQNESEQLGESSSKPATHKRSSRKRIQPVSEDVVVSSITNDTSATTSVLPDAPEVSNKARKKQLAKSVENQNISAESLKRSSRKQTQPLLEEGSDNSIPNDTGRVDSVLPNVPEVSRKGRRKMASSVCEENEQNQLAKSVENQNISVESQKRSSRKRTQPLPEDIEGNETSRMDTVSASVPEVIRKGRQKTTGSVCAESEQLELVKSVKNQNIAKKPRSTQVTETSTRSKRQTRSEDPALGVEETNMRESDISHTVDEETLELREVGNIEKPRKRGPARKKSVAFENIVDTEPPKMSTDSYHGTTRRSVRKSNALDAADPTVNEDTLEHTAKKTRQSVPKPDIATTSLTKRKGRRKTVVAVEHENVQPEIMTENGVTDAVVEDCKKLAEVATVKTNSSKTARKGRKSKNSTSAADHTIDVPVVETAKPARPSAKRSTVRVEPEMMADVTSSTPVKKARNTISGHQSVGEYMSTDSR